MDKKQINRALWKLEGMGKKSDLDTPTPDSKEDMKRSNANRALAKLDQMKKASVEDLWRLEEEKMKVKKEKNAIPNEGLTGKDKETMDMAMGEF